MQRNRLFRALAGAALCLTALPALAQPGPPIITSIQSVIPGVTATGPPAVTSGVNLPNGFTMVINGTFHPANFKSVDWLNTVTSQAQSFAVGAGITTLNASQIQLTIPFNLFNPPVALAQGVTITVSEAGGSATGAYTLNPPLTAPPNPFGGPGIILLPGTVGVPYSQPMAQGGTPPYNSTLTAGAQPPGLILPVPDINLAGTPTQTGTYTWTVQVTDLWTTSVKLTEATEIVAPPAISSILPNVVPAGSPNLNLTINGANYVDIDSLPQGNIPGTSAAIAPPLGTSGPIPLSTQFINPNQVLALVPQAQLISPGTLSILVAQPSGASSATANLNVVGPAITSLNPNPVTARGTPVTLTVNGTNFTQNPASQPAQSTILIGGRPVPTTFGAALTTNQVFSVPGQLQIQVQNPGGTLSNQATLTVLPTPAISSISPAFASAGTPFLLTLIGTNFAAGAQIVFNGTALPTTVVNAATLTATVPAASVPTAGNYPVTMVTFDGYSPAGLTLPVFAPLQITTTSLPGGTNGQPYAATVTATGGLPPYTFSATGLQSLSINSGTGAITGTITAQSNFVITVTVKDANGVVATASFTVVVTVPVPPIQITTGNSLPVGTVGVSYSAVLTTIGGSGTISFSLGGGALPAGLGLSSGGSIVGTPTAPGTFTFTVEADDTTGHSASAGFTIVVKPAPLTVTGPATIPNVITGAPVSLQFGATGGVPPYTFNFSGTLPPGTNFFRTGSLTGSATGTGTFTFTVYAIDSTGAQASKSFTITVTLPQLTVTGSLANGQVGVPYNGTVGATGGQSPYTITVGGLPAGLAFANGVVGGTPTTPGAFTVAVSVTDATGANASQNFAVNIAPAVLTITTTSLNNGTVGAAYTGSVSATGGVSPYTFAFSGLPGGVTGSSSGSLGGTPSASGTFSVTVTVTDSKGAAASKTYTVTIGPPVLTISPPSITAPTVGTALTGSFTASGGTPPYTFSATGLPAGITLSSSGQLSGAPSAPGPATVKITVTDSTGASASTTLNLTIALPPTPPLSLTGLPATSNPDTQSNLQIGISTAYPVDVTVTLTLTFAADSGPDDPTVQFATGGRTATMLIPAGSLAPGNAIGVQTGTVAGTATITARLTASSQDITPSPAPTSKVRIAPSAPVITSVTAATTSSGFTVTIVGYVTTRSITSAVFTFTAAPGANLQTTTLTIPVDQLFSAWYGNSASTPFGSQFTFTQPFNVQGGVNAIASVSVTLVNGVGSSAAVGATVH